MAARQETDTALAPPGPTPDVAATPPGEGAPARGRWSDVLGVVWVAFVSYAVLASTLAHSLEIGPYSLLYRFGLGQTTGAVVHPSIDIDQAVEMTPWAHLTWSQVHAGHLPLWNPYSALGMPLAFNWQSAPFGLPALVGYLFPMHLAYTVQILTTLFLAGTGTYLLMRVLRCGPIAAAFSAAVFEVCGAFMLYLGWPLASVFAMSGWLFAATILIVRNRHRARDIAFLAVVLAFAVYAGQPDALIILMLAWAIFVVVLLALRALGLGGRQPAWRPFVDLVIAAVAGLALGAPLLLPGLQVAGASVRGVKGSALSGQTALSLNSLGHLLITGLDGHPLGQQSAYLGVIPVVLAVAAVGVMRRRPAVIAFLATAFVMFCITFLQPVMSLMNALPGMHSVRFPRALVFLVFPIAVLAGLGMDLLVRSPQRRRVLQWVGWGFVASAAFIALSVLFSLGHLPGGTGANRVDGILWALAEAAAGLAVVAVLRTTDRRSAPSAAADPPSRRRDLRPWLGAALVGLSTAYLLVAGQNYLSSGETAATATPAELTLHRIVGSSLVGFGVDACDNLPGLGIEPDANIDVGVQELAVYDPMVPRDYFKSWKELTGQAKNQAGFEEFSTYCPPITSATIAREYGVSYVLEPHAGPGPAGGVFVRTINGEDLYRIPDSGLATLTPPLLDGSAPPADAAGRVVPVDRSNPDRWMLTTDASTPQVLRLHLTDAVGWKATIDGKPLKLTDFGGVMLQADVPAGTHHIVLHYWPTRFTIGLVLAFISLVALVVGLLWPRIRRRRPAPPSDGEPAPPTPPADPSDDAMAPPTAVAT